MRTERSISLLLAVPLSLLGACSQESPPVAEEPAVEPPAAETTVAAAADTETLAGQLDARKAKFVETAPPERVAGGRNDLTQYNGDDSLELPLAVTYVIGTDGIVEYAFVDADYRKRAETSEVVEFVTQLAN